jgi:hypothetical protein
VGEIVVFPVLDAQSLFRTLGCRLSENLSAIMLADTPADPFFDKRGYARSAEPIPQHL